MLLGAYYHVILATLFAFLAVFLMIVILLQRGRGVGLSGAFGGVGGHTAFGAKTGDVLTWATIVIATLLLAYTVVLNYVFVPPKPFEAAPPPAPVAPAPATPAPSEAPAEGGSPTGPQPVPQESCLPDGASIQGPFVQGASLTTRFA